MAEDSPTRRTVLIAGAANLFVGVIKLAAGILVGSSAMLAEAAHSAADTLNQAFLLASLHRGGRPADSRHPFGYGQERYFWSLLAAFGIFIAGAGLALVHVVFLGEQAGLTAGRLAEVLDAADLAVRDERRVGPAVRRLLGPNLDQAVGHHDGDDPAAALLAFGPSASDSGAGRRRAVSPAGPADRGLVEVAAVGVDE